MSFHSVILDTNFNLATCQNIICVQTCDDGNSCQHVRKVDLLTLSTTITLHYIDVLESSWSLLGPLWQTVTKALPLSLHYIGAVVTQAWSVAF